MSDSGYMAGIQAYQTRPAAVLEVSGEDHVAFLQSQGTADLKGDPGMCRYCLWLDHKGLIHGDAFALKIDENRFLLVSYETPAKDLVEKFERHIIADDVDLKDVTTGWNLLSFSRDGCPREEIPSEGRFLIEAEGTIFPGRRFGNGTIDILLPDSTEPPFEMEPIPEAEAERMRIRAGIPSVPRDLPAGGFNPLEANLLSALSFDKGCYLGQEVVARVHRLQRVSRRLVRASGGDPAPGIPTELTDEGTVVGGLSSVAENPDNTFCAIGWLKSRYPDGPFAFGEHGLQMESLPES